MAVDSAGVVALSSGVPLVVLGALLMRLAPRRRDALALAVFAVLWGLQIVLANLGRTLQSADVHAVAYIASMAFLPFASIALMLHGESAAPGAYRNVVRWAMGALVLLAIATLVWDPGLVAEVVEESGVMTTRFGPAWAPFFVVPFYLALWYALYGVYLGYRRADPGTPRRGARAHVAAFAAYASYASVDAVGVYADSPASVVFGGGPARLLLLATALVGVVLVAGLALALWARPVQLEPRDLLLLSTFIVPAFVAVVEITVARRGTTIDTVGLWRILMVVVLVYSMARNELFDLDLRLQRVAWQGLAALALGLGAAFGLLVWVAPGPDGLAFLPVAVGGAAAGIVWTARDPVVRFLFPGVVDEAGYRRQRALDVYRARLERHIAAGGRADDPSLAAERRELDVRAREHGVLVDLVRAQLARSGVELHGETAGAGGTALGGATRHVATGVIVAGRYRIDRLLGQGAHGRAFLANDVRTDRNVVVKVVGTQRLGGTAATALLREARVLRRLHHPNIVRVVDVVDGADECLLVLEYAEGGNLQGLVARRGRLPEDLAVRIADEVLAGLEAAHAEGIVHRDVKPENVLLTRTHVAMLADFGVARVTGPDATDATGAPVGTLLYMSPEQVRGRPVDARTDLYAVGVMLHVLLTGRYYLPLAGRDDYLLRQAIVESEPDLDLRALPPWAVPLLHAALAKDPERRFSDAASFRRALREDAGARRGRARARPVGEALAA